MDDDFSGLLGSKRFPFGFTIDHRYRSALLHFSEKKLSGNEAFEGGQTHRGGDDRNRTCPDTVPVNGRSTSFNEANDERYSHCAIITTSGELYTGFPHPLWCGIF